MIIIHLHENVLVEYVEREIKNRKQFYGGKRPW